jgi:hypothetical protein
MDKPVQALQLVLSHLAKLNHRRLNREAMSTGSFALRFLICEQFRVLVFFSRAVMSITFLLPETWVMVKSMTVKVSDIINKVCTGQSRRRTFADLFPQNAERPLLASAKTAVGWP